MQTLVNFSCALVSVLSDQIFTSYVHSGIHTLQISMLRRSGVVLTLAEVKLQRQIRAILVVIVVVKELVTGRQNRDGPNFEGSTVRRWAHYENAQAC